MSFLTYALVEESSSFLILFHFRGQSIYQNSARPTTRREKRKKLCGGRVKKGVDGRGGKKRLASSLSTFITIKTSRKAVSDTRAHAHTSSIHSYPIINTSTPLGVCISLPLPIYHRLYGYVYIQNCSLNCNGSLLFDPFLSIPEPIITRKERKEEQHPLKKNSTPINVNDVCTPRYLCNNKREQQKEERGKN